uniref:Uncharacterized protein n=1 Tax=Ectopseudomonas oleovorans TaxID=301 RepID=A0A653B9A5_ECTOL
MPSAIRTRRCWRVTGRRAWRCMTPRIPVRCIYAWASGSHRAGCEARHASGGKNENGGGRRVTHPMLEWRHFFEGESLPCGNWSKLAAG